MASVNPTRRSTRTNRSTNENATDPVAPAARCKPTNPKVPEKDHLKQTRLPERVAKAAAVHPKPEPAIVPSKRKRGALADITIPNQTKKATRVDTDPNPKYPNRLTRPRQSPAPAINKNQIQLKPIRPSPPRHKKVITVYETRSTTTLTASRQITSREQHLREDVITVAPSRPASIPVLPVLRSATAVSNPTGPVQPSQEGGLVQEEGQQEPRCKRRKLSEALVEGESTGRESDLPPCSEAPIRAEDGEPDDLDKEDAADPCMEPEYQAECYQYMRELEISLTIKAQHMKWQKEVDRTTRGALADWIIAAHRGMRMLPETLYLTINLLDRMLSKRQCSLSKLQLLGITCLRIAAKYEETWCLAIDQFVALTEGACTAKDINNAERYILGALDWNLSSPGPMSWLRRASKAEGYDGTSRTVAKYLMEIAVAHPSLCEIRASLLAATALYLARLYLNKGEWTASLAYYTGYKERDLMPIANEMVNFLLMPIKYPHLHDKYASKKHLKVSVAIRQWALYLWDEGAEADLSTLTAVDEIRKLVAQFYNREEGGGIGEQQF